MQLIVARFLTDLNLILLMVHKGISLAFPIIWVFLFQHIYFKNIHDYIKIHDPRAIGVHTLLHTIKYFCSKN